MSNNKTDEEMENDNFIIWCRNNGYKDFADRLLGRIKGMRQIEKIFDFDGETD